MLKTDDHTRVSKPAVHCMHIDSLRNNVSISTPSVKILFLLWSLLFIALYSDSARSDQLSLLVNNEVGYRGTASIETFEKPWSGGLQYKVERDGLPWVSFGFRKTAVYATHVPNFNTVPAKSWVIKMKVASKDFW